MQAHRYTVFCLHVAGVYQGKIVFKDKQILFAKVDTRRRTQIQVNRFPKESPFNLPIQQIHDTLTELSDTTWSGDEVVAKTGDVYHKHIQYRAPALGQHLEAQVWARRNDMAVDIVTVDGGIVAFVIPHRYGLEVLVREGYESLTPLSVYDDALLSQPEYGADDLGTFLIPMRDGVRLATDVYLPEIVSDETSATWGNSRSCHAFASNPRFSGPFPTILVRPCYDRKGKKNSFMHWVNKGYAVVVQDVRGCSDSEGELVPFYL